MPRRLTFIAGVALAATYAGNAFVSWFCRGLGIGLDASFLRAVDAYIAEALLDADPPDDAAVPGEYGPPHPHVG
jgi:hypothetical protein